MAALFQGPKIPTPAPAPPPPKASDKNIADAAADEMRLRAGMGRASTILTTADEQKIGGTDNRVMASKALGL